MVSRPRRWHHQVCRLPNVLLDNVMRAPLGGDRAQDVVVGRPVVNQASVGRLTGGLCKLSLAKRFSDVTGSLLTTSPLFIYRTHLNNYKKRNKKIE